MTAASQRRPTLPRRLLVAFGVGLAMGVAGYLFGRMVLPGLIGPDRLDGVDLRWSDALAALTGVALMMGAGAVLIASLDPRRLGRIYRLDEAASAEEVGQVRLQASVLGFSGVILLLPLIFVLVGLPGGVALGLIVVLFVVHTALNLKVWRSVDELMRRTTMEAAFATFFLGQGLLFLWAAAERLGLVFTLTAWDVYAVLMTLYLFVSAIASARRGLA